VVILGFALAIPLDLWFFLAQRNSRSGQFPPFHWFDALQRLARYTAANVFGGLPLYFTGSTQSAAAAILAALTIALAALIAARWRHIGRPGPRAQLAIAAAAPALGLLLLGVVFNNTPIELRYLAFTTPFAAILLAGALASLSRAPRIVATTLLLGIQSAALVGLATAQAIMQPARATAAAAALLAQGDAIVLIPRGNDGVGIVGAFAIEAPPALRLLVVDRDETPARILARVGTTHRVVLALLAQDDASRATLPTLRATFAAPCWRAAADGFNVAAFDSVCQESGPWVSSTASPSPP
jgi:hypothetical protein